MNERGFTPLEISQTMALPRIESKHCDSSNQREQHSRVLPENSGKISLTGFTLVEVMIATSIMLVVLGIALSFSVTATNQAQLNTDDAYTTIGTVRILERLKSDISGGTADYLGIDTSTPPAAVSESIQPAALNTPVNSLTLRKLAGFDTATNQVIYTKPIVYSTQLAPGEGTAVDGVDNNGNGYADELVLVRISDPGGAEQEFERVTTDIMFADATGFTVTRIGNLINIQLEYLQGDGQPGRINTSFALLPPITP